VKIKKLKTYLRAFIWVSNESGSVLSRAMSPGHWSLMFERCFDNKYELDTWMDAPLLSASGETPRQLYEKKKDVYTHAGHPKYKLEILRK
jgi:hypothetical protein